MNKGALLFRDVEATSLMLSLFCEYRRRDRSRQGLLVRERIASGRISALGGGEAPLDRPLVNDMNSRLNASAN